MNFEKQISWIISNFDDKQLQMMLAYFVWGNCDVACDNRFRKIHYLLTSCILTSKTQIVKKCTHVPHKRIEEYARHNIAYFMRWMMVKYTPPSSVSINFRPIFWQNVCYVYRPFFYQNVIHTLCSMQKLSIEISCKTFPRLVFAYLSLHLDCIIAFLYVCCFHLTFCHLSSPIRFFFDINVFTKI